MVAQEAELAVKRPLSRPSSATRISMYPRCSPTLIANLDPTTTATDVTRLAPAAENLAHHYLSLSNCTAVPDIFLPQCGENADNHCGAAAPQNHGRASRELENRISQIPLEEFRNFCIVEDVSSPPVLR